MTRIIIISGLSGSGKSIALNTLEDDDFYCIDNLPIAMLPIFIDQIFDKNAGHYQKVAIGIDSRSSSEDIAALLSTVTTLKNNHQQVEILFLTTEVNTLLTRFSETRRKHPLTSSKVSLLEAIHIERKLLADIADKADLTIDTSNTNIRQLRSLINNTVIAKKSTQLTLLLQSFGFKNGVPADSDFVFDVRCLPNPYWHSHLRNLSGEDEEVIDFLNQQPEAKDMIASIHAYLEKWIPSFRSEDRSYLTISIGCTGGHHRSVYCINELESLFNHLPDLSVSVRHRELE